MLQADNPVPVCMRRRAGAVRCCRLLARSASSATVSIRSCRGITSSSQAITTTARNSKPLARCMVPIETWPFVVSIFSSSIVNARPLLKRSTRPIQLCRGSNEHAQFVGHYAFVMPFYKPLADRFALFVEVSQHSNVGGGPLNTEIVSARSSVLPSTSDTSGPNKRSPCMRIWWEVR